ncbi:hypothetical protein CEXT_532051 [Caerostris extrusa]|uniref:Reverse transcriptase/retrotransposon-derived protein RNase H-like domain-containing protein n=1 Tax=Caerostris extrusa TaxID=172846 RepID=A0AAV4RPC5_CAEEX|nr:hypothetical protein CEXT_532051 [Caerostris extrusa]
MGLGISPSRQHPKPLKCLTTLPVLKQADGTKPYIVRTDASNYALGAALLQGVGSDEHPIDIQANCFLRQNVTIRQRKEKLSLLSGLLRNSVDA